VRHGRRAAPAIDGDVVTWLEEVEPRSTLDIPRNIRLLVRGKLDLTTGKRCRTTKGVAVDGLRFREPHDETMLEGNELADALVTAPFASIA
jgi:hypothetical protein